MSTSGGEQLSPAELRARVDERFEASAADGLGDDLSDLYRQLTGRNASDGDDPPTPDQFAGEVAEAALIRLRAIDRVDAAVRSLVAAGPASEIIARAPAEAARAVELDRVLLSRVDEGRLVAEALYDETEDSRDRVEKMRQEPANLAYPLAEAELLRRRRAEIVAEVGPGGGPRAFAEAMSWDAYVAAPVVLDTRVIGFFHADRAGADQPLTAVDRDALSRFADGFAVIFERAVLRRRLRIQRQELRRVASWADALTSELSDAAVDLTADLGADESGEQKPGGEAGERLRDLLTKRELDVLDQMVNGKTNAEISQSLVVSVSTVKFHVKNVLRKLGASNRAEAGSRYLRLMAQEKERYRDPRSGWD